MREAKPTVARSPALAGHYVSELKWFKQLRSLNCCQLLFFGDNVTTRLQLVHDDNPVETMTSPGCKINIHYFDEIKSI